MMRKADEMEGWAIMWDWKANELLQLLGARDIFILNNIVGKRTLTCWLGPVIIFLCYSRYSSSAEHPEICISVEGHLLLQIIKYLNSTSFT